MPLPHTLLFVAVATALLSTSAATATPPPLPSQDVPASTVDRAGSSPLLARRPPGAQGHRKGRLPPAQRRQLEEKVRKRIDTFVTVELASELDLDQKTALMLLDAWRAHRDLLTAKHKAAKEAATALQQALKANASDAEIQKKTNALRTKIPRRNDAADLLGRTEKFLNARQQAKLLLAYPQIQREVRKMMRKARRRGGSRTGLPAAQTTP